MKTGARRGKNSVRWLLLVILLAGCDQVLGITPTFDQSGAAGAGLSSSSGGEAEGTGTKGGRSGASPAAESGGPASASALGSSGGGAGGQLGTTDTAVLGGAAGGTGIGGAADGGSAGEEGGTGGQGDGGWTPGALNERLGLWLACEGPFVLEDGAVAEWHDLSSYQQIAMQAEPTARPTRSESALAGMPGVIFDGQDDLLTIADHPALQLGTGPFAVEIVLSHTTSAASPSSSGGGIIFSKQSADLNYPGVGIFANRPTTANATTRLAVQLNFDNVLFSPPGIAYNDGVPHVLGMQRSDAEDFALRLDGAVLTYGVDLTVPPIDVSAAGFSAYIGTGEGARQSLQGVISEVVVVRDATSEDVTRLEAYLRFKYRSALGR